MNTYTDVHKVSSLTLTQYLDAKNRFLQFVLNCSSTHDESSIESESIFDVPN